MGTCIEVVLLINTCMHLFIHIQCVTKKELEEALHDYKGELVLTITKAMLDHGKAFIDSLTQTGFNKHDIIIPLSLTCYPCTL